MVTSDAQPEGQVAVPAPEVLLVHREPVRGQLEALFDEVNALQIRLKQAVRGFHSETDSTFVGQDVLQILAESGAQTVPQIARVRSTSRQNIQILVNRLKARGCVELVDNPAHKKSVLVRLTPRGQALLTSALAEQERFKTNLLSHLGENELSDAVNLLRRVRNLLIELSGSSATVADGSGALEQLPKPVRRKPEPATENELPTAQDQLDEHELPVNLL